MNEDTECDAESQQIAKLNEADRMLEDEYEQGMSTWADFVAMIDCLLDLSIGLTEKCMSGLIINFRSGLTPLEMSRQYYLHLSEIGRRPVRVKTLSMTMHRLERKHLARKVREGRTFRYFLTQEGYDDDAYRREKRQKMRRRILVDRGLLLQHLSDRRKVIETEMWMLQYQRKARRKVRGFDVPATDIMKWCLDLANTVLVLKYALINEGSEKLRSDAIARSEQCLAQLAERQRAVIFISLIDYCFQ
jgi:predicted transcriptional regulator